MTPIMKHSVVSMRFQNPFFLVKSFEANTYDHGFLIFVITDSEKMSPLLTTVHFYTLLTGDIIGDNLKRLSSLRNIHFTID